MATDNLKYCKWCKHTMLKEALVCQQCRYGQSKYNKPGLSKILEIASIVIALCAVLFAWQQASSAANSLAKSEQLSTEFDKQAQNLALLDTSTSAMQTDTNELSSIVADSLRLMHQNIIDELATDKSLLELLCPSELTAASLRLDCDIKHVEFSASAVDAVEWFTQLSPAVAENSGINKLEAIDIVCGYRPDNIDALFNASDYVMGLENFVPFQNLSEVTVENTDDVPTEGERQKALSGVVIELYHNISRKWVNAGINSYEKLEKLCS